LGRSVEFVFAEAVSHSLYREEEKGGKKKRKRRRRGRRRRKEKRREKKAPTGVLVSKLGRVVADDKTRRFPLERTKETSWLLRNFTSRERPTLGCRSRIHRVVCVFRESVGTHRGTEDAEAVGGVV